MDSPSVDLPSVHAIIGVVWACLEARTHSDARPRVGDVARAIGWPERRLRRAWASHGRPSLRSLVTYACLTYAMQLIAEGVKPAAAAWSAGFKSYWNFNRQCKQYTLNTARYARAAFVLQLVPDTIREEAASALRSPLSALRPDRTPSEDPEAGSQPMGSLKRAKSSRRYLSAASIARAKARGSTAG